MTWLLLSALFLLGAYRSRRSWYQTEDTVSEATARRLRLTSDAAVDLEERLGIPTPRPVEEARDYLRPRNNAWTRGWGDR